MIKEVAEIPKPNVTPNNDKPIGFYREALNKDISEAFDSKIAKFELVGYDAKPDYLIQAARAEAYYVCDEKIYKPAKTYVKKKLNKEFDSDYIRCVTPRKYSPNYIIRLHGVTLKDGIKHMYCEIDFKAAGDFKKQLLAESREMTKDYINRVSSRR